jgi:hypothetical protein
VGTALSCICSRDNESQDLSDIYSDIDDIFDNGDVLQQPQIVRTAPLFRITLCRYDSGMLLKSEWALGEKKYIAVSHAWGAAEYRNIPEVNGKVKLSNEKGIFIADRLSFIIKDEWFWMDILCID